MIKTLTALAALLISGPALADDCDFANDPSPTFSWNRVMSCFESVPFNHDDLENILENIAYYREISDTAGNFNGLYGWRARLQALNDPATHDDYSSDLAMHDAIKAEHKAMKNPHVRYASPDCYYGMLTPFIPFDIGSTRRFRRDGEKQILFIEDTFRRDLVDLYEQATGIDIDSYVGMKIVSINGQEPLTYFRQWGRTRLSWDDSDSTNLMGVLNRLDYFYRSSQTHDFLPRRAAEEMVLESRNGTQVQQTFPWIFFKREALGFSRIPLSAGTDEFIAACYKPNDRFPYPFLSDAAAAADGPDAAGPDAGSSPLGPQSVLDAVGREQVVHREKTQFVRQNIKGGKVTLRDFFEAPPGLYDRKVEPVAAAGSVLVQQFDKKTTAIRFFDTVDNPNWINTARTGVEHACEHSDDLIIDVRRNGGGSDTTIEYLYKMLFPEVGSLKEAGRVLARFRNDNAVLNESLVRQQEAVRDLYSFFGLECLLLNAGCMIDASDDTLIPEQELAWNTSPTIDEVRGGELTPLSRLVHLPFGPGRDNIAPASCAGKFGKTNLTILTDGSNCSGGYYIVKPFKENDVATVVTMGGYVDEDIPMGICRTGATFGISTWPLVKNIIEFETLVFLGSPISFTEPLPTISRDVDSNMELPGSYRLNELDLDFDDPVGFDVRINVWSDSPATDGYVYQRTLEAARAFNNQ